MKVSKIVLTLVLSASILLGLFTMHSASAESSSMNSTQMQQIRDNCTSVKSTLNQLHVSDTLLRVNMGQMYESLSTKLMERFDSRLASNSFNNSGLSSITRSYEAKLDIFRSDYQAYEESLASTIKIDCVNQPVVFYDSINSTRSLRSRVHDDVSVLGQYIDQYQAAVDQFNQDYKSTLNGVSK